MGKIKSRNHVQIRNCISEEYVRTGNQSSTKFRSECQFILKLRQEKSGIDGGKTEGTDGGTRHLKEEVATHRSRAIGKIVEFQKIQTTRRTTPT